MTHPSVVGEFARKIEPSQDEACVCVCVCVCGNDGEDGQERGGRGRG